MNKPTPAQWEKMILILAIMLGTWLRFSPTVMAGDVINDGGMFYSMVHDLMDHHYALPQTVSYNDLDIPFAYPPLPFYLTALLSDLFRLPLKELFRWLPAAFSTLSILAFYRLARVILKSSAPAVLATVAFALMPRAYTWFVMGGGVSRALGQFFLLLVVWGIYQVLTQKRASYILWTILFGSLVALSHPGQLLHAIALCAFLWLFLDWRAFSRILVVAFGVSLLTAPWWLTVALRHGFAPFLAASQTGGFSGALFWLPLLLPTFAEEQFLTLFTIFGLLGLAAQLIRRQYLLPLLLLIPFVVDPRSASSVAILSLAMLAGIGLNDLVVPAVAALAARARQQTLPPPGKDWPELFASQRPVRWLLGYFVFIALLGAYAYNQPLVRTVLPESGKEAMAWVRENTPPDSAFLLVTGIDDPFADPVQEWFPVLAKRVSVATLQGREWSLGADFIAFHDAVSDLQGCLNADPACVEAGAEDIGLSYDYLYLQKAAITGGQTASSNPALLAYLLRVSPNYALVYESPEVVIFARLLPPP
ncbi:MAG: hypothetical protein ACOYYU_08150 [Chloroflexota bacterium]